MGVSPNTSVRGFYDALSMEGIGKDEFFFISGHLMQFPAKQFSAWVPTTMEDVRASKE